MSTFTARFWSKLMVFGDPNADNLQNPTTNTKNILIYNKIWWIWPKETRKHSRNQEHLNDYLMWKKIKTNQNDKKPERC